MLNITSLPHPAGAPSGTDLVHRLTAALDRAHLDCGCRTKLDEVLARFEQRERLRDARTCLAGARTQREKIEVALLFLNDLDSLSAAEDDRSAYVDIALLFENIAEMAKEGASAMRALCEIGGTEPETGAPAAK